MPTPLSTIPSLLLPGAAGALLLAALGGFHLASGDTPLLGVALGAAALGVLGHALWSVQRRVLAVIEQSTRALRDLGEGRNAFQLDAHQLPAFDPLLLAIDDLREGIEPTPQHARHEREHGHPHEPRALTPRHA